MSAPARNVREPRARDRDRGREASGPQPVARNRRTRSSVSGEHPAVPGGRLAGLRERGRALVARLLGPVGLLLRLLAVGAAIAGAIALLRAGERYVRTAPAFAIREIEVEGTSRLGADQVRAAAGLALGANVFDVSPGEAERRLRAEPWIASAQVRRRLPGRFRIEIRERSSAAILVLEGPDRDAGAWIVGDDGSVIEPLGAGAAADLPVLTGIARDRFTSDRSYRTRILLAAVALMSDYRAAGLWRREPISEIHVEPDDGLTLRIGDDATEIRLGQGPYRPKLDRLRQVLDTLAARSARPAYVYLDAQRRPDRVVLRVR